MKMRSILFGMLVGAAAASQAQTFSPVRSYKEGASDSYSMKMDMDSSMGKLGMSMDMKSTVKKVYENGDADVESAVSNLALSIAGQEMKPPAGKPTTMRINKFGMPVEAAKGKSSNFNMMQFTSQFGDKELKLGETMPFENVDKDNPKRKVKGTAKLSELKDGIAVIVVSVDSWTEASETPMHLDGTSRVNAATGVLNHFEGKATNLPSMGGPGMTISSATFVIDRKG